MEPEYYSQEGMEKRVEDLLSFFRESLAGTVSERVPMHLYQVDYGHKTLTIYIEPTPWMADRTGGMSNGAFSVALDQAMGIICLYFTRRSMTPTVTMQLSLLRPIPLDRRLYIKVKLLGTDGTKVDVAATAWSEGGKDAPVCSAVGIYYAPNNEK